MRRDIMDGHIRQMAEPEPLRSLRRQLEQIEDDERRATEAALNTIAADNIRNEIRRRGRRPCA